MVLNANDIRIKAHFLVAPPQYSCLALDDYEKKNTYNSDNNEGYIIQRMRGKVNLNY